MSEEEKGIRIYNPKYSRSLIDAKAHEAGFPVAFQGEQFDRLLKLMFDLRLCVCKVYDEESWNQIKAAWSEDRHFHMIPRWKPAPEAVATAPLTPSETIISPEQAKVPEEIKQCISST